MSCFRDMTYNTYPEENVKVARCTLGMSVHEQSDLFVHPTTLFCIHTCIVI